MTAVHQMVLICNAAGGCEERFVSDAHKPHQVRILAAQDGWSHTEQTGSMRRTNGSPITVRYDYCPAHTPDPKGEG